MRRGPAHEAANMPKRCVINICRGSRCNQTGVLAKVVKRGGELWIGCREMGDECCGIGISSGVLRRRQRHKREGLAKSLQAKLGVREYDREERGQVCACLT